MNPERRIWLRLTGRPEIEKGYWLLPEARPVTILRRTEQRFETVEIVPTGHTENGIAVWVPEDRRDDWPPEHQRLINILKDLPEEESS